MKVSKILFVIAFLATATLGSAQTQDLKKGMDESLKEMESVLENLDLNKLFNEELFGKIEQLKPSDKELNQLQGMMEQSLKMLNSIDLTALEGMAKEMEKMFEGIELPNQLNAPVKKSKSKKKTKQM